MRAVPNIREYQESLEFEQKNELINVLHQKQLDGDDIVDLLISFNKPDTGREAGEIQGIETLSGKQEFTVDDLDDDDLNKVKELFADALMSYFATKNGLANDEFPEFEAEGIDDILLAPGVEDYDKKELAVGIEVEREHTEYPKEAQKIAKHHLGEDEKYYTKLLKTGLVDEKTALELARALDLIEDDEYAQVVEGLNESINTEIFITDLGISPVVKPENGAEFSIPRFAIWSIKPGQKPNVIETSDNVEGLLDKYKLTESDVIKLMN